jgi:hypothetical protein
VQLRLRQKLPAEARVAAELEEVGEEVELVVE